MTNDETCGDCFFYVAAPNGQFGWCKHAPPVLVGAKTLEDHRILGVFNNPTTAPDSFCSKWEEK